MKRNVRFSVYEDTPLVPIKTEADYEAALYEVERAMGHVEPETPQGDRFSHLIDLIEAYEDIHYPMGERSSLANEVTGDSNEYNDPSRSFSKFTRSDHENDR